MTRWRASGLHLMLSVLIATMALSGMLIFWFPWTYFQASGGDRLLKILVMVDVVAGPLLTLIIYKAGKKGLKFDLWVIGICQLAALLYGLHVLWLARPVFLVFVVDRFNLVFANQVPQSELDLAKVPEYKSLSWNGPRLAFARVPSNADKKSDLLLRTAELGRDIETMPVYFEPISGAVAQIVAAGFDLDESLPETAQAQLVRLREATEQAVDTMIGLPLIARGLPKTLVVDRESGTPLGVLDYNPW